MKYVVYSTKQPQQGRHSTRLGGARDGWERGFFENPLALPRFRIVHDVIPAKDESDALKSVQRLIEDSSPATAPALIRAAR